jgi:hypothetical protein
MQDRFDRMLLPSTTRVCDDIDLRVETWCLMSNR